MSYIPYDNSMMLLMAAVSLFVGGSLGSQNDVKTYSFNGNPQSTVWHQSHISCTYWVLSIKSWYLKGDIKRHRLYIICIINTASSSVRLFVTGEIFQIFTSMLVDSVSWFFVINPLSCISYYRFEAINFILLG